MNEENAVTSPATSGSEVERVVSCATTCCDCCEEEWEAGFFCKKCSGIQHFDGEMVFEPNCMWDGSPGDEYVWKDREPEYMDICFNCCNCQGS